MARECSYLEYSPDRFGHVRKKTVNHVVNIKDFENTPGYVWLVIAANPQLSARDIQTVLRSAGPMHHRSESWINRHRWLFREEDTTVERGPGRNTDGLDGRAFAIIAENGNLSSRQLAGLMRANGVPRSPEWVRRNRLSMTVPTNPP